MPDSYEPDLFHGVDGNGNCLPGPSLPFGLVRLGPDTCNGNTSGYASGEGLRHFSHLHVAGTGGGGRYGCIGILPEIRRPDVIPPSVRIDTEEAAPGFYRCILESGVSAELTATRCCGMHRYIWNGGEPWLRIDLGACIGGRSIGGWALWRDSRTLVGRADYRGGWGHDHPYSVFFHLSVSEPIDKRIASSSCHAVRIDGSAEGAGMLLAVRLGSAAQVVLSVGISFVSVAQAERHLHEEVGCRSFDDIVAFASKKWRDLLGRFRVEGGTAEERTLWSTMWQRLHTMPTDLGTDETPWFASERRQFNDLYCLWDSVRCANSLFALIDAPFAGDLCTALTEIGEHTGSIPDAWKVGAAAAYQGGCSAAVLFAEAAAKNLPGFDPKRGLAALRRTQENYFPDPLRQGRFPGWREQGFLPEGIRNCASRTIEYAFHDECTARLAEIIGDIECAAEYRAQARRLWESWHPRHHCFAPRNSHGDFVEFDPWKPTCSDFWNDPYFYEGTAHDFTLTSWHIMDELVLKHGGQAAFKDHLDRVIDCCYMWKEINLHVPWLYYYAGAPDLIAPTLRRIADVNVRPGRCGLSDNEDMGSWSSWWLTAAMGLGPIPGSDRYLVAVPRFSYIVVDLIGQSSPLIIKRSGKGEKILNISVNGQSVDRLWIEHGKIHKGAEIEIQTK